MAKDGSEALALFKKHLPPVCVIDFKMPGMNGLELLKEMKRIKENTFVIIITAYADMEKTIEAMKFGAYDFLKKPFDNDNILTLIRKAFTAYELISSNVSPAASEKMMSKADSEFKIIGNSPKMQDVYKLIGKISGSLVTVMITGESGSGKEMIARAIHSNSPCSAKQFIAINCSAIPENLIESELFGHEKGSFTGAINRKIGKFELASGGTLFLDEVAEMSMEMQTKFLRVLQEREIVRVGGNEVVKVDPRIIAATNIDLEKALSEGKLREDLYHRLKVISIHVPPLRERIGDIADSVSFDEKGREHREKGLASFFVEIYSKNFNKKIMNVAPEVMEFFLGYEWPGNIRELKNVIESAVAICRENTILLEHLPFELVSRAKNQEILAAHHEKSFPLQNASRQAVEVGNEDKITEGQDKGERAGITQHAARNNELVGKIFEDVSHFINVKLSEMGTIEKTDFYSEIMDVVEKLLIDTVLKKFKGNQVKTSKFLGINRNTLRSKIEKYQIDEENK